MKLTPSQDLFMEVLAARHRLGEMVWTFDARQKNIAVSLEKLGFVNVIHPVVPSTFRASLTDKGREEFLDTDYVPPILRRVTS